MVEKYRPELKGFATTNHPGALGEGLDLAEKVGASFTDIEQIQIHPTVVPKNGHLISESMRARGAILVNKDGKRFTNELLTRDVVSQNVLKQKDGVAYLIYDQSIYDSNKLSRGYFEQGYSVKASDVKDLAAKINVPLATLEATMKAIRRPTSSARMKPSAVPKCSSRSTRLPTTPPSSPLASITRWVA